jgi:hypothetical protein
MHLPTTSALRALAILCIALGLTSPQARAAIVVNGLLNDWNVTVSDNNGSNFSSPNAPFFMREDTDDLAGDGGFVGPLYGGQNYDGEFLAARLDGTRLSIVVVSGQRPDNGLARFGPGDIRIVTSAGTFGIEVGGGAGGGSGTQIVQGALGATYRLNSHGFTAGVLYSNGSSTGTITGSPPLVASALQTAGSVWKNPTWIDDPIPPPGPTQMQFVGGTYVGLSDYVYTRNSVTTQHSIIELGFDAYSFIGNATINSISWRPSCGNDELDITLNTTIPTPEPASLAIWSLLAGAAGCLGACRIAPSRQRVAWKSHPTS